MLDIRPTLGYFSEGVGGPVELSRSETKADIGKFEKNIADFLLRKECGRKRSRQTAMWVSGHIGLREETYQRKMPL